MPFLPIPQQLSYLTDGEKADLCKCLIHPADGVREVWPGGHLPTLNAGS